jgi:hypothetical protein
MMWQRVYGENGLLEALTTGRVNSRRLPITTGKVIGFQAVERSTKT